MNQLLCKKAVDELLPLVRDLQVVWHGPFGCCFCWCCCAQRVASLAHLCRRALLGAKTTAVQQSNAITTFLRSSVDWLFSWTHQ